MRILQLTCAMIAALPGIAAAQFVVENEEQAQAIRQNEQITREIHRSIDELEKERLGDPGYRASRVAGARLVNERVINIRDHPGFAPQREQELELAEFRALALTGREYGQLLDVLAELDVQEWILGLESVSPDRGTITPAVQLAAGELLRKRGELQVRREQAVTALLGAARYQQWLQYQQHRKRWAPALLPKHSQQTVEVSYRLEEIRSILAKAGQHLSEPQVLPLAKALMAGVQRERLKSGLRDDHDPMAVTSGSFQSAARGRVRENRAGILEDAAPLLDQPQVAAVTAAFARTGE